MNLTSTATAFKEWACIVEALGKGEQILILRKGGIHEKNKKFSADAHEAFFLFPTYEHQNAGDLNPRGQELLSQVQSKSHASQSSEIPIQYFCELKETLWIENFEQLQKLSTFHVWSEQALQKRYTWGEDKGVWALIVRVSRLPQIQIFKNLPAYGGCRSWVELETPISLEGLRSVQTDQEFQTKLAALRKIIPSA